MRIEVVREPDVDERLDAAIRRLQVRAFPTTELFKVSRHYTHAARPGDLRVLAWEDAALAGQVVVFFGRRLNAGQARIAGIGNVCTDPDFRGRGYVRACMDRALAEACGGRAAWALLFCSDQRRPMYERFGFAVVDNEIDLTRPDGTRYRRDRHDLRMIAPLCEPGLPDGELVLDLEDF